MMSTKTKNIERRNIQISGGSTYVISLPKKWIEKLNLKNGDSMQIVTIQTIPSHFLLILFKKNQQPILKLKLKKQTL